MNCVFNNMKPIDTITISYTNDILKHQIKVKESGNYQLSILATLVERLTVRKAYQVSEINIDIDKDPEPEPEPEPDQKPDSDPKPDQPWNYNWL